MAQETRPKDYPKLKRYKPYLAGKSYTRAHSDLMKRVKAIAEIANIPEIQAKAELLQKILHTSYVEDAGIREFEHIREELRDLMKYVPITERTKYVTDFEDRILSQEGLWFSYVFQ